MHEQKSNFVVDSRVTIHVSQRVLNHPEVALDRSSLEYGARSHLLQNQKLTEETLEK
jgi:hypothetical protein